MTIIQKTVKRGQNTSSAVTAYRHQLAGDLDFFPTPPWATRALCEHIVDLRGQKVWEPACGRGHMAKTLAEYAGQVNSSDITDRGYGDVFDFLSLRDGLDLCPPPFDEADWVISNPPFDNLHNFITLALANARCGVAMFGRLQLLEGVKRYKTIYAPWDGHFTVAPFVERVPIEEGCVAADGKTATAYAWLVVDKLERRASPLVHIPPCRARLERPEDYDLPEYVQQVRAVKKTREAARKAKAEADAALAA